MSIGFWQIVLVLIIIVPGLIFAIKKNRTLQEREPGVRPYRWGYFVGFNSVLGAGLGIAYALSFVAENTASIIVVLLSSSLYAVAGIAIIKRFMPAWILLFVMYFIVIAVQPNLATAGGFVFFVSLSIWYLQKRRKELKGTAELLKR